MSAPLAGVPGETYSSDAGPVGSMLRLVVPPD